MIGAAPWFDKCWNNGQQIRIAARSSASGITAEIQAAVGVWNSALADPRTPDVPRFLHVTDTSVVDLFVEREGSSTNPCGDESGGVITLRSECGPGAYRGTITDMLVHELGEPLGFQSAMEAQGVTGVSDHCVNVLRPGTSTVNGSVCQHELAIVRRAYGYGSSFSGSTLMSRHIVTGFQESPTSMSFSATGQTAQATVVAPVFHRAHPTLLENPPAVASSWESSADPVAAVNSSSGLVTAGTQAGQAIVSAEPSGSLPTNVIKDPFWNASDGIAVTVAFPPPPSTGFRVSSISGIDPPITVSGSYPVNATVVGVPAGSQPLQVQWMIIYSIGADGTGPDTLTSAWGAASRTVAVHAGSYHLRIRATPRKGTMTGTAYTLDTPVCATDPEPQFAPGGC